LWKQTIHAEIADNVSNRMNTSQASSSMPPAANAEQETALQVIQDARFGSNSEIVI